MIFNFPLVTFKNWFLKIAFQFPTGNFWKPIFKNWFSISHSQLSLASLSFIQFPSLGNMLMPPGQPEFRLDFPNWDLCFLRFLPFLIFFGFWHLTSEICRFSQANQTLICMFMRFTFISTVGAHRITPHRDPTQPNPTQSHLKLQSGKKDRQSKIKMQV